jgi:hydrogen peroxide-dependent heme synthase
VASDARPAPTEGHGVEHGLHVLHLFCTLAPGASRESLQLALKGFAADDHQLVTAAMLGHRGDLGVLALAPDATSLRDLQTRLAHAGASVTYSYVSMTEVSEYAAGVPETMRMARLYPELPPAEMPAFCFYPMSKRRQAGANWYELDYEARLELMRGHGETGRRFRGRVVQLVTGSTGLDDFEWGVTLFGRSLADVKECVYEMRFDPGSARYAEFGPFLVGTVASPDEVLQELGL